MGNFLSAVFTNKSGQLEMICDPEHTDSHALLIASVGMKDDETSYYRRHIAKCELTPPADTADWGKLSKWQFKVDETETPDWLDQETAREMMERRVAQMFIKNKRGVVMGGCWIVSGKKAGIKQLVRGRVVAAVNGADLSGAYLSGANLSGADLYGANLYGANLSGANLSGAYLSRANLYGADLSGAYLSRANLYGADLSGADLSSANLSGADLSRADLSGADLSGAINYTLPDTWSIDLNGIVTRK